MAKLHNYQSDLIWTGHKTNGPAQDYKSFSRAHEIRIAGKPVIMGSADPSFLGDETCHNPEDLLLASLSACHMLWYLHLGVVKGLTIIAYEDQATGIMQEDHSGGHFTNVTLHPHVTIADGDDQNIANALHAQAHQKCFIANSVNFEVLHQPRCNYAPHQ